MASLRTSLAAALAASAALLARAALADPPPRPPPPAPGPAPAPAVAPAIIATPVTPPSPAPTSPAAKPNEGVGFAFGVRAGWAFPFAKASDSSLSDVVPSVLQFGGDVGYFLDPHLYLGGYVLYGFGIGSSSIPTCSDPDFSCSSALIRFGVVADWHARPNDAIDPWIGGGIGYEILNLTATDQTGSGNDQKSSLHGFEIIPLRAGVDYKPSPSYGFGPYVEVPVGHYATASEGTPIHGWVILGIRVHSQI